MIYSVIFQYMYTLYNTQTRVISTFINSHIHHFFVLGTFSLLSSNYFEIHKNNY